MFNKLIARFLAVVLSLRTYAVYEKSIIVLFLIGSIGIVTIVASAVGANNRVF